MTNPKSSSVAKAHRSTTPMTFGRSETIVMAASIVVGMAGGGLVLVNPVLGRQPNSMSLTARVVPSLDADRANLRSPAALRLASSLVTSDLLVPQASPADPIQPVDPIRILRRWFFRFFFPTDPI
jgi:hypothetical protein